MSAWVTRTVCIARLKAILIDRFSRTRTDVNISVLYPSVKVNVKASFSSGRTLLVTKLSILDKLLGGWLQCDRVPNF